MAVVAFLRSRGGDPVNCLWVVDAATGEERLVGDPGLLVAEATTTTCRPRNGLAASECREGVGGITS